MLHPGRALAAFGLVLVTAAASGASDAGTTLPGGDGAAIVGGIPTHLQPTTGALLFVGPDTKNMFLDCSGVLIGCRTILTAAHCVCGDADNYAECIPTIEAYDDVADLRFYFQHSGIHHVRNIYVDPTYDRGFGGDLAILRLSELVTGIEPSPFHQTPPTFVGEGTRGVIAGFGNTNDDRLDAAIKRVAEIETDYCPPDTGVFEPENLCWDYVGPIYTPGDEASLCLMDDGGPLFVDFGEGPEVTGIHAGSGATCDEDSFSYATSVVRSREWIKEIGGPDVAREQCSELGEVGEPWVKVEGAKGRLPRDEDEARFVFDIPEEALLVRVTVNGDTRRGGDYDLFVGLGNDSPTRDDYDCAATGVGQFGACELEEPGEERLEVLIRHIAKTGLRGRSRFQVTVTSYSEIPPHPTTPPRGPDNLRYTNRDINWRELVWFDDSNDEDGFEIARRPGDLSSNALFEIRDVIHRPNTEDYLENVPDDQVWTYRVRAFNVAGNSEWSNLCVVNKPREVRPTRLRSPEETAAYVRLKWRDNSNDESYMEVQRRKSGALLWKTIDLLPESSTEYIDDNVEPGEVYEYRVRARGHLANCIKHSRFSRVHEVVVPTN